MGAKAVAVAGAIKAAGTLKTVGSLLGYGSVVATPVVAHLATRHMVHQRRVVEARRKEIQRDPALFISKRYLTEFKRNKNFVPDYRALYSSFDYGNQDSKKIIELKKFNAKYTGKAKRWEDSIIEIVEHIYDTFGKNIGGKQSLLYARSDARISAFFEGRGGNCEANTKLIISELYRAGFKLPQGMSLGVQVFKDHVQPVIVDMREKGEPLIYDILTGQFSDSTAPVYHPLIFAHGYLKKKGLESSVTEKELLILAGRKKKSPDELPYSLSTNTNISFPGSEWVFSRGESPAFGSIGLPGSGCSDGDCVGNAGGNYIANDGFIYQISMGDGIHVDDFIKMSKDWYEKHKGNFRDKTYEEWLKKYYGEGYEILKRKMNSNFITRGFAQLHGNRYVFLRKKDANEYQKLTTDKERKLFIFKMLWRKYTPLELESFQRLILSPSVLANRKFPITSLMQFHEMMNRLENSHYIYRIKFKSPPQGWRVTPKKLNAVDAIGFNRYFPHLIKAFGRRSVGQIPIISRWFFNRYPERHYFDQVSVKAQKSKVVVEKNIEQRSQSIAVLGCTPGQILPEGFTCNAEGANEPNGDNGNHISKGKSSAPNGHSPNGTYKTQQTGSPNGQRNGKTVTPAQQQPDTKPKYTIRPDIARAVLMGMDPEKVARLETDSVYSHIRTFFSVARTNSGARKWLERYFLQRRRYLARQAFYHILQKYLPKEERMWSDKMGKEMMMRDQMHMKFGGGNSDFLLDPNRRSLTKIHSGMNRHKKVYLEVYRLSQRYGRNWFLYAIPNTSNHVQFFRELGRIVRVK